MAEFGELRPGTEWRTPDGQKVLIREQSFIPTWVTPASDEPAYEGRIRRDADSMFYAYWVRWVEPIAVGDRVTVIVQGVPRQVLGTFTTAKGRDFLVLDSIHSDGGHGTFPVSECRKVNDE